MYSSTSTLRVQEYCTVSCRGQKGPVVYQTVLYLSPQREARGLSSHPDWDVFELIKPPTSAPAFVTNPQPPISSIKLSTACSSPLCSIHVTGKSPTTSTNTSPQTHRTVCLLLWQKGEINKKMTIDSSEREKPRPSTAAAAAAAEGVGVFFSFIWKLWVTFKSWSRNQRVRQGSWGCLHIKKVQAVQCLNFHLHMRTLVFISCINTDTNIQKQPNHNRNGSCNHLSQNRLSRFSPIRMNSQSD